MVDLRKISIATGTFCAALSIGFVMQNEDAIADRFAVDSVEDPDRFEIVQASLTDDIDLPFGSIGAESSRRTSDVEIKGARSEATDLDCVPVMTASADVAATIQLSVVTPCHSSTPFTVHHQGMIFTAKTNEHGTSHLVVPALSELAVVVAAFAYGDVVATTVTVPDFLDFERAVLQWEGDTPVMLNAYEYHSDFESKLRISKDNPGDFVQAETGAGGYLLSLGDTSVENALMAEVYTYPAGMKAAGGNVAFVVEAEITSENCDDELNTQSIQVEPTGDISAVDLIFAMPGCDSVGDFLVLQNMFQDLTLASR